jgi:hypothetical protein
MKPFIFISLIVLSACASEPGPEAFQQVRKSMDEQVDCWNAGDIPCFMATYWKSEHLRFIGSDGITKGWQETLDRYLASFPDKETMGTLRFEISSMQMMGANDILVVGRFYLERDMGNASGTFSLIWEKIEDDWVITLDHTSSDN